MGWARKVDMQFFGKNICFCNNGQSSSLWPQKNLKQILSNVFSDYILKITSKFIFILARIRRKLTILYFSKSAPLIFIKCLWNVVFKTKTKPNSIYLPQNVGRELTIKKKLIIGALVEVSFKKFKKSGYRTINYEDL